MSKRDCVAIFIIVFIPLSIWGAICSYFQWGETVSVLGSVLLGLAVGRFLVTIADKGRF